MTTIVDTFELLRALTPMLADHLEADIGGLRGTHWFEQKYDGIRALIATGDEGSFIRNRNGTDVTGVYPEIQAGAHFALPTGVVLDGEIVAVRRSFADIAKRDKQRSEAAVAKAVVGCPAKYVAFDILHHPVEGDIRHWKYHQRRGMLESLNLGLHGFEISIASPDPALYDQIKVLGGEGVVAKRLDAPYGRGRSRDWLKFKATRTVTAIVHGYEAGRGSRADCGAFLLCMLDDVTNQAKSVGKVGSGLTTSELAALKKELDQGRLPVIEVETLGRTTHDKLRQPVYKGLRTDLELANVRINQLNALPRG